MKHSPPSYTHLSFQIPTGNHFLQQERLCPVQIPVMAPASESRCPMLNRDLSWGALPF
jgi:hypothetical protein